MDKEIRLILYIILLGYTINACIKLHEFPTATEEKYINNIAKYPDFTICGLISTDFERNISSFSDIMEAIEYKKKNIYAHVVKSSAFKEM